jgi:hypothetical protein
MNPGHRLAETKKDIRGGNENVRQKEHSLKFVRNLRSIMLLVFIYIERNVRTCIGVQEGKHK